MKHATFAAITGIILFVGVGKMHLDQAELDRAYTSYPEDQDALFEMIKSADDPEEEYYEYLGLIQPNFRRHKLRYYANEMSACEYLIYEMLGDNCREPTRYLGVILKEQVSSRDCTKYYVALKKYKWNEMAEQQFCKPFLSLNHYERLAVILMSSSLSLVNDPIRLRAEISKLR